MQTLENPQIPSIEALVSQFGQLGFVSQATLAAALRTVEPAGREAFVELSRKLWSTDMLGWERVEVACALSRVPADRRAAFVGVVHVLAAQALLPLRWAPDKLGARAMRAVVETTAKIDPNDWAGWVASVQRLCARSIEYFDAPKMITALAALEAGAWADFIYTVEQLCPENLDSHNRSQIVAMLAHSKLVEEKRSRLLEHVEMQGHSDPFELRDTIANFIGTVSAQA